MIDSSLGDIHIYGNPHFWLDPLNGKIIAQNILDGLRGNSPDNAGCECTASGKQDEECIYHSDNDKHNFRFDRILRLILF